MMGELCDVAKSLETDLIGFGHEEEGRIVLGKPFPLVIAPKNGQKLNFV